MARTIAIIQSSYIPWKGYFDIIRAVDAFVFLDDAQFTRRDWRSRNRIKTATGTAWLSIPVDSKGKFEQPIDATSIAAPWARKHWTALTLNYARAPFFAELAPAVAALYEAAGAETMLSAVNAGLIHGICGLLGITTPISFSRAYPVEGVRTARLLSICRAAGAQRYLSGPSAAAYIDRAEFDRAGIELCFADYSGYPAYPQLFGPFEHGVSVLDLLFNTGPEAIAHMKRLLG